MTYDNNRLAEMYRETFHTHRGDGVHKVANQIARVDTPIHDYFAQHGSLDGARFRGIDSQVKQNIEKLLC